MGKKAVFPAVRRQLGQLSRLRNVLSQKAMLQLVKSLAMSKLNYMLCLWGNSTTNYIKRAQIV